jgi:hypothetical protein
MPGLDQMNEQELIAELQRLAAECDKMDREINCAIQRRQFCRDRCGFAGAIQDEQALLAQMNWLMDRRRAVEGHLMRVRGQLRPLKLNQ